MTTLKAIGETDDQKILWMALFVKGVFGRRGLPYVLMGDPGTAKTSIVAKLAKQAGLVPETVMGSLRSPLDYLGVPVPRDLKLGPADQHLSPDGEETIPVMHYAPSGFSVRASLAKEAMILMDEANTAPPVVQAAMLRVVLEGVVGELELPPTVRILLAMNRTEDAAGGWDLSPAMANRLGWLEWNAPDLDNVIAHWASGGNAMPVSAEVNPAQHAKEVDVLWDAHAWPVAVGAVSGFLKARPNLLHKKPPAEDGAVPWPSARSWEMAMRAYAGCQVYGLEGSALMRSTAAFIGHAAFQEFYSWVRNADLPSSSDLLDGAVNYAHSPDRLDRTAAVLSGALALITPEDADAGRRKARTQRLWALMGDVADSAPDLCVPCARGLVNAGLVGQTPAAYKMLAKIDPMLQLGEVGS